MVKTYESRIPPSPNLDKVTVCFDKLNNTPLIIQSYGFTLSRSSSMEVQNKNSLIFAFQSISPIPDWRRSSCLIFIYFGYGVYLNNLY